MGRHASADVPMASALVSAQAPGVCVALSQYPRWLSFLTTRKEPAEKASGAKTGSCTEFLHMAPLPISGGGV